MKEISLHLLDLIENAVAAGATAVEVEIDEDVPADRLRMSVQDNGRGMPPDIADRAADPFATTRTTRSVGMGIALLSGAAEQAGGRVDISSTPGAGTRIDAEFQLSHIDRAPLGRIEDTLAAAAIVHPDLDLRFTHRGTGGCYEVNLAALAQTVEQAQLRSEIARLVNDGRRQIHSVA